MKRSKSTSPTMKRSKSTSPTPREAQNNFDSCAKRFCRRESLQKSVKDDLKVEFDRNFPNEVFKVRLSLKYNGTLKYTGNDFPFAGQMCKDLGLDEDTELVFPELPGWSSRYVILYPAFFKSLKYLMTNLHGKFQDKTLLIHGVSKTGKSTLALCLALLISILHGTCELFVFSGKSGSMDLYNESISSYIAEARCPVVVDQCNLHNPNVERIFKENSNSGGVLILFTSGNYAPEVSPFTTFDHVRFLVLEMPVSQSDAKKLFDVDEKKSKDIVAKSSIYGLLKSPEYRNNPKWETLFTNFHPDRFLNSDMGDKIKEALTPSEEGDLIYCDPIIVSRLARAAAFGGVKDESEVDFKLFFSMLEVKSKENVQRDDSDIFYHPDTYDYIIRYKEGIMDAYNRYRRTAEERNKTINLFKSIEQYQKAGGSEKGKMFERIIDETCDAYGVALRGNDGISVKVGLRYVRGKVLSFVQVDHSKKKVSSLDEVVECIEEHPNGMIWISFVENFKGFDFVNMTVSERKVKEVQLLQMTTNLSCKGSPEFAKMKEVCTKLKTKLTTKQMLTDDGTIIPFIILPFDKYTQVKTTKEKTVDHFTCELKVVPYNLLTDIISVIDSKAFAIV